MPSRLERVTVRLTPDEQRLLAAEAKAAGLSVANYLRTGRGLPPLAHGGSRLKPKEKPKNGAA